MQWQILCFFAFVSGVASLVLTHFALKGLRRAQVMDNPNARSNHATPVPRGGGIAMISVILVLFAQIEIAWPIWLCGVLLMLVSLADDLRGLSAKARFAVQFAVVLMVLPAVPSPLPAAVPMLLAWIIMGFMWIWFINLTNFMDGIDGISAMQAIMQMLGIILLAATGAANLPAELPVAAAIIAASALGFLRYNYAPAKLFMGDAGSIPLGFLIGYLLFWLAGEGYVAAALLLPAYYLTDATHTLLARALRGERIWQAHSQHAYQKAVRSGLSHTQVVKRITALNGLLVVLALISTHSMMAGVLTCAAGYLAAYLFTMKLAYAPARQ